MNTHRLPRRRFALAAVVGVALILIAGACGTSPAPEGDDPDPTIAEPSPDQPAAESSPLADSAGDPGSGESEPETDSEDDLSDGDAAAVPDAPTTAAASGVGSGDPVGPLLIAGADGVHLVDGDVVATILDSAVIVAVDDRMGGLVVQAAAGRWANEPADTVIRWLPAGATDSQALLVPTGQQWLTLVDVDIIDGGASVVYLRAEGTQGPDDFAETLRTYDFGSGAVAEVRAVGAWESGPGQVTYGGGIYAHEWFAEAQSGFAFFDGGGDTVDVAADPYPADAFCFDGALDDGTPCPTDLVISEEGDRIAYIVDVRDDAGLYQDSELVVADTHNTAQDPVRILLNRQDASWLLASMHLSGTHVLINRTTESGEVTEPALLVDLTTGGIEQVQPAGAAVFTHSIPSPAG